ncbi:hypothetical protein IQ251_02825 [Saccharopolyspora sp. HNM0983]|uniref:DUF5655 domain-containing protein n=2 Tax=Saccharopolyspora montiporae TaxID=2781240 RepID=A0A929G094_9PSEU|nr:DUF5655 domain-containing protein [Saccharopolyspora sp. HNM0983]MBE9373373.1 hypothetical protein [Saccharopolyspora sp. HNM0983]
MREWQVALLERATGHTLATWNASVREADPADEAALRDWLRERGVTGYAQMLLVHEHFGYPEFFTRTGEELIERQYADRPALRPVFDAVIARLPEVGPAVTVQTRKTYVSLLTPRRTFAVVAADTKSRVDVGLRFADLPADDRLLPAGSRWSGAMTARFPLTDVEDVDEVVGWLRQAYRDNE